MSDEPTAGEKWGTLGDFSRYVIVDRVGESVERIDNQFEDGRYPKGESGLVDYWRQSGKTDEKKDE